MNHNYMLKAQGHHKPAAGLDLPSVNIPMFSISTVHLWVSSSHLKIQELSLHTGSCSHKYLLPPYVMIWGQALLQT